MAKLTKELIELRTGRMFGLRWDLGVPDLFSTAYEWGLGFRVNGASRADSASALVHCLLLLVLGNRAVLLHGRRKELQNLN